MLSKLASPEVKSAKCSKCNRVFVGKHSKKIANKHERDQVTIYMCMYMPV